MAHKVRRSATHISRNYAQWYNQDNAAAIIAAENLADQEILPRNCRLEPYDVNLGRNLTCDEQVANIVAVIGNKKWEQLIALKEIMDPLDFYERLCDAITRPARPDNPILQVMSYSLPAGYAFLMPY